MLSTPESYPQLFQNFLTQKYTKNYHIISSPAITFSLASKTTPNSQLNLRKIFQTSDPGTRHCISVRAQDSVREFYEKMKKDVSAIMQAIFRCLEMRKFALSEFFQYQQLVLSGFFQAFVDQLMTECREKGQFLSYIWTQNTLIMHKMLENYQQLDQQAEIQKNTELRDIHTKYCEFIQKQTEKIRIQYECNLNLKNIVQILVQKLRIRRKQVRKLFKETQQLISVVNQFRDKNIELEMKYLTLMESLPFSHKNSQEIQDIEDRKAQLNCLFRELIGLQNNLNKNTNAFQHEINLEGPLEAEDFIKEASEIIHGSKISDEEIKAEIDIILDKYEVDFEETMLRLKKTPKRRNLELEILDPLSELAAMNDQYLCTRCNELKISRKSSSTQVTNLDRHLNNLIKSTGMVTNLEDKIYRNNGVQCQRFGGDERKIRICKTVQYCYGRKVNRQPRISLLRGDIINEIDWRKSRRKESNLSSESEQQKQYSQGQIQQEGKQENFENKQNKQEQLKMTQTINIKMVKMTKNRKGFNNKNNPASIKQRFSIVQNSPRKIKQLQKRKSSKMQSVQQAIQQKQTPFSSKKSKRTFSASVLLNASGPHNKIRESIFKQQSQNGRRRTIQQQKNQQFLFQSANKNSNRVSSSSGFSIQKRQSTIRQESRQEMSRYTSNLRPIPQIRKSILSQVQPTRNDKVGRQIIKEMMTASGGGRMSGSGGIGRGSRSLKKTRVSLIKQNSINTQSYDQQQQQQQQGIISIAITRTIKRKYFKKHLANTRQPTLPNKLISELQHEARAKAKEYALKTRKLSFFIKHNNIISIISSTFARAYQKMSTNHRVQNFIECLYECMMVLYGKMPKQQINKKISNFIAQVLYKANDNLCRNFVYFLGLDQQEQGSTNLTIYDNHLYLKLVAKISLAERPFEEGLEGVTCLRKVSEMLPEVFRETYVPENFGKEILRILGSLLQHEHPGNSAQNANISEKKLNTFSCARVIINQLMKKKQIIKASFKQFINFLTSSSTSNPTPTTPFNSTPETNPQPQKPLIQLSHIHQIVKLISLTKIDQIHKMSKIQQIPRKNPQSFTISQFSTAILILGLENWQDFYIRILNKFGINNSQKHGYLKIGTNVLRKGQEGKGKGINFNANVNANVNVNKQCMDVLVVRGLEEICQGVLEDILGGNLVDLFCMSILIVSDL